MSTTTECISSLLGSALAFVPLFPLPTVSNALYCNKIQTYLIAKFNKLHAVDNHPKLKKKHI